jgi:hypothetical protein
VQIAKVPLAQATYDDRIALFHSIFHERVENFGSPDAV